jgi:hypothetical protein
VIRSQPAYTSRVFYLLALPVLLATAPPVAMAQASLRERLDSATVVAVQPVIDSAAASGLPTRPLVSKALEGAAKHADGQRIVAAVRTLSADLALARSALGAEAGEDALVAGVGALRAGASPAYLREIRETRGAPAVAWPLVVLADLVGRGVPVDTAAGVVLVLARAGAADNEYVDLQAQLRRELRAGARPDGAAHPPAPPAPVPPRSGSPSRPARPDAARHP